jgi:hypothetical protein
MESAFDCDDEDFGIGNSPIRFPSPSYQLENDILSNSLSLHLNDRDEAINERLYAPSDSEEFTYLKQKYRVLEQKIQIEKLESANLRQELQELKNQRETDENVSNEDSKKCKINVGGTHFEASLAHLVRFPTTRIAEMFSQSFVQSDCDEGTFIARDGKQFRHILNYMRYPEYFDVSKLELSAGDVWELKMEAMHYGLFEGMFPSSVPPPARPVPYRQQQQYCPTAIGGGDRAESSRDRESLVLLEELSTHGRVDLPNGRRGSGRLRDAEAGATAASSVKVEISSILTPKGGSSTSSAGKSSSDRESMGKNISPVDKASKRRVVTTSSSDGPSEDADEKGSTDKLSRSKQKSRKDTDDASDLNKKKRSRIKLYTSKSHETSAGGLGSMRNGKGSRDYDHGDLEDGRFVLNTLSQRLEQSGDDIADCKEKFIVTVRKADSAAT